MTQPILMICLDASEHTLIERWINAGLLPNLARLRQQGSYQTLRGSAEWLSGSAFATHHTGQWPETHGHYHYIQWRAESMSSERVTSGWVPLEPFWRDIASQGKRVVVFDVPLLFKPQAQANLVEICGWATHDMLDPYFVVPEELAGWFTQRHGPPIRTDEYYGPMSVRRFCEIRDRLIASTERAATVIIDLMKKEPWDLFMSSLSTVHRGGHKLWDLSALNEKISASQQAELGDALQQVYVAVDVAIGRIIAAAGHETTLFVYANHGMGPNTSFTELLPKMLGRVLSGATHESDSRLEKLRRKVPFPWRQRIKHLLPYDLQDKLTSYWRMGRHNWSQTRAMAIVSDNEGFIRINQRGREAKGIVRPGVETEQLCEEIIEGLNTFVDAGTGEPIVKSADRATDIYPAGHRLDLLPDIVVRWADITSHQRRAIISSEYGSIAWPTPGQMPDGRSGNHRPYGYLLSNLPATTSANSERQGTTADIAPTAFALLDLPVPEQFAGQPLFTAEANHGR